MGFIGQFDYKIGDETTAFMEVAMQHNTSEAGGAATPLDEDAGLTVPVRILITRLDKTLKLVATALLMQVPVAGISNPTPFV